MAPRSIWNGTIVFGLVTVLVKVYSATESKSRARRSSRSPRRPSSRTRTT
jgi:non-homologous end joining protein Ku